MNGDDLLYLKLKNNFHGRVKELINDPLFFNQNHAVKHLLKPLICLVRMGVTDKPIMDQVLHYVYKNRNNMEDNAKKPNNTDILRPEGRQVPNLAEDDEVDQDSLASWDEDD